MWMQMYNGWGYCGALGVGITDGSCCISAMDTTETDGYGSMSYTNFKGEISLPAVTKNVKYCSVKSTGTNVQQTLLKEQDVCAERKKCTQNQLRYFNDTSCSVLLSTFTLTSVDQTVTSPEGVVQLSMYVPQGPTIPSPTYTTETPWWLVVFNPAKYSEDIAPVALYVLAIVFQFVLSAHVGWSYKKKKTPRTLVSLITQGGLFVYNCLSLVLLWLNLTLLNRWLQQMPLRTLSETCCWL